MRNKEISWNDGNKRTQTLEGMALVIHARVCAVCVCVCVQEAPGSGISEADQEEKKATNVTESMPLLQ